MQTNSDFRKSNRHTWKSLVTSGIKYRPGFSLIEVMVALLVTSTGLLGIAKMQALTISTTKTAGSRSLIAMQTSSLAARMQANTAFWAAFGTKQTFFADSTTGKITSLTGNLQESTNACVTKCTSDVVAARDMTQWMQAMSAQVPSYKAQVDCSDNLTGPVSCTIYGEWNEKMVAMNKTTAIPGAAAATRESFTVHVTIAQPPIANIAPPAPPPCGCPKP